MAVSATSKALLGAAGYSTKWHQKRIHRKLDDRDDVIDEALEIIEDFDTSVYPYISAIVGLAGREYTFNASGAIGFEVHVAGKGLAATDTVTAVLGGVTAGTVTIDVSASKVTLSFAGGAAAFTYNGGTSAAGDIVPLYVRVNNVLLPTINITLT